MLIRETVQQNMMCRSAVAYSEFWTSSMTPDHLVFAVTTSSSTHIWQMGIDFAHA
jgi:hypothetical protein